MKKPELHGGGLPESGDFWIALVLKILTGKHTGLPHHEIHPELFVVSVQ